jgi:hypothetical protein
MGSKGEEKEEKKDKLKKTNMKFNMKSNNLFSNVSDLSMSLDPRARRLGKVLSSGVMDLQEEKFGSLNIAPTSVYDQYHRLLRSNTATVKQTGGGSNTEG